MNPDNAFGYQCKDVADDYAITIFGSWVDTVRPGNGKDVFNNANPTYFTKVLNDWKNPNQIPPRGALINWGASRAVPEGHVAVVESATNSTVTVIQQDGYLQYPARRVTLGYVPPNGAAVIGWLIPKLAPVAKPSSEAQVNQAYLDILERPADPAGLAHYVNYSIDFVRADLLKSAERAQLEGRKAAAAKAAADAAARAEALRAEEQRIAEEKAAAERARAEAERLAEEVRQAEALAQKEREELARKEAEEKARAEAAIPTPPIPPVHIPGPEPAAPVPSPSTPQAPNPIVLFLFSFIKWYNSRKK
jgi:hypothetical protein